MKSLLGYSMCNLNPEDTRITIKLLRTLTKAHNIISLIIVGKITVNPKYTGYIAELYHRYLLLKFPRFWEVVLDGGVQRYLNR